MLDQLLSPTACYWWFAIGVPLLGALGAFGEGARRHNQRQAKVAEKYRPLRFALPDASQRTGVVNSALCAAFAVAAYSTNTRERDDLRQWCSLHGYQLVEWRHGNAEGILVVTDWCSLLAIAGTNDRRDAVQDGLVYSTELGKFCAAQGFQPAGNAATRYPTGMLHHAATVRRKLEPMSHDVRKARQLWVTGHSLGGAVAELLPQIWTNFVPTRIVTFGAPRTLRRWTVAKQFVVDRWQSIYDVVPKLPFVFYTHAPGQTYHVLGVSYFVRHLGLVETAIASVWPLLRRLGVMEGHRARRYYDYLEELSV